jgi:hypothetical protein
MIDAADIASGLAAVNEKHKSGVEALSQFTVVRLQNHPRCHLIWTVHHALVDRWSESLIASSVEQAYLGQSTTEKHPGFNTFIRHITQQSKEASDAFWEWPILELSAFSSPNLYPQGAKGTPGCSSSFFPRDFELNQVLAPIITPKRFNNNSNHNPSSLGAHSQYIFQFIRRRHRVDSKRSLVKLAWY